MLPPRLVEAVLSPRTDALIRGWATLRHPRRPIELFYRADDPYCVLLLQALQGFERPIAVHVVPHPERAAMPHPALAAALAVADARELTRFYDLRFEPGWTAPTGPRLAEANAAAMAAPDLQTLWQITEAAWAGGSLDAFAKVDDVEARLARGARRLRRGGHYFSGMLAWRGEWYWGVDRLRYLEARLGLPAHVQPRETVAWPEVEGRPRLEFYFSFRSPYSYLALERVHRLQARFPVQIDVRPVLPMVMRGLEVPRAKRLYIVRDCAREARRLGIPFGRVADPVGVGVERCLAVAHWAARAGRDLDWMRAAGTAIWSEGVDMATDRGLRAVVERAGFDWAAAAEALADPAWRGQAESNREALLAHGLWGVPCFVLGEVKLWGQDRLDILEAWLERFFPEATPARPDRRSTRR